ncbi:MAG: helix-turn-helix domain-containing protein [Candidatus Marinimicrobia bacterium]|nr:helix-turn-helix domain-containing protein [Candidatus Neomarinimicrobiota bacterium]
MANLNKVLGDEIRRLARKEARLAVKGVQNRAAELRTGLAAARKRIASLEQQLKQMPRTAAAPRAATARTAETTERRGGGRRPTGQRVAAHRAKLGLSRKDYARLAGVSEQAIYRWENTEGPLTLRGQAKTGLAKALTFRKRAALAQLA